MAKEINVEIEVKSTWIKPIFVFVCKYIRSSWLLGKLSNFTLSKIYINGKFSRNVTIKEVLETDKLRKIFSQSAVKNYFETKL